MKLTPAASTLTRASPFSGSGRATSSSRSASAPPGCAIRTAFMPGLCLPLRRHLRGHVAPGVPCLLDGPFILDRGDVAGLLAEGDGLQHPAHDLAAARLGEHVHEVQLADDRHGAQLVPHRVEELLAELVGALLPL